MGGCPVFFDGAGAEGVSARTALALWGVPAEGFAPAGFAVGFVPAGFEPAGVAPAFGVLGVVTAFFVFRPVAGDAAVAATTAAGCGFTGTVSG